MLTNKIIKELHFKAVRSSGSGGQNVNKVSSKIILSFDVKSSMVLSENEKILLKVKLYHRISSDGILIIKVDENRSQFMNKKIAIDRFLQILEFALVQEIQRKPTSVPNSQIRRRLKNKHYQAVVKKNRQKPYLE